MTSYLSSPAAARNLQEQLQPCFFHQALTFYSAALLLISCFCVLGVTFKMFNKVQCSALGSRRHQINIQRFGELLYAMHPEVIFVTVGCFLY